MIRVNPVHIRPYHYGLLFNMFENGDDIYITPKADGEYHQIQIGRFTYESENINDQDFIFNILTDIPHIKTQNDRFKYIERLLSQKMLHETTNISEIVAINNTNQIVCKPVFRINKKLYHDFKDVLNIFLAPLQTPYPNDGWIVYTEVKNINYVSFFNHISYPLKIKPRNHMTIDLLYDPNNKTMTTRSDKQINSLSPSTLDKSVWRCSWNDEEKKWMPISRRYDKILANKDFIVNDVVTNIETYWQPYDVINYMKSHNHTYYDHTSKELSKDIIEYLNKQKVITSNILEPYLSNAHIVLDLGCGNGKMYHKAYTFKFFGIDNDPIALCKWGSPSDNICVMFGDLNVKGFELFTNHMIRLINSIDLCVMNHSISYVDNLDTFFNDLSIYMKHDGIVFIRSFVLEHMKEVIYDSTFKIVHNNNNIYSFTYPWLNREISNKIYSSNEIITSACKYGFNVINNIRLNDPLYHNIVDMQRIIILKIEKVI